MQYLATEGVPVYHRFMWTAARVFSMTDTDGLDALFKDQPASMTAADVAELLGLTKQAVYGWLREGTIPGYKVGSTWFVVRDELKATMRAGSNARPNKE